ncbi:efflux RND transporter periplasmic adaptor subunit [candidate division CSSED10-310 bacterium]|uniref:Efflux RND transporter periplasmic adaptor subunit n=1 Tax=candidate division CSSED10-310 bacterium TaxID=2855610 RepID=A0ABV6YZ27_UNCC1
MRRKYIIIAICLVGFGFVTYKTLQYFNILLTRKPKLAQLSGRGTAVKTAKVVFDNFGETIGGYGRLISCQMSEISNSTSFPVKVHKIFVTQGQFVKKDTLLLEFDRETLESSLQAAKDAMQRANSAVLQFNQERPVKKTELMNKIKYLSSLVESKKVSLKIAESKYKNAHELLQKGLSHEGAVDEARLNLETAKYELEDTQYQFQVSQNQLDNWETATTAEYSSLLAELSQAKHELNLATDHISLQKVKAPVDGVITAIHVKERNYVAATEKIIVMADADSPCFLANISAEKSKLLQVGMAVTITFDDFPQISLDGETKSIGNTVSSEEKTFDITISVNSLKTIPFKINLNGFARIEAKRETLVIPSLAIFSPAGYPTVIVVENGKASYRRIIAGTIAGGMAEVKNGLQQGEEVVIYGKSKLRDGDLVNTAYYK